MKYPITPEYVQAAGEYLTPLYQDLEDYVIQKICEQLKISGEANATALELIRELQRRGLDLKEIEKRIRKTLGISQKELNNIFQDAITRNELFYGDVLNKMELVGEAYQLEAMRLEADAIARQTMGEFVNLTQSMGFAIQDTSGAVNFYPIKEAYQKALDKAAVQVLSGADSYDVAIRQAVKSLSDSGIQVVDYESGHHDRIDVAARRAVMTGVVQISSKYTEQMAEDIPTPYREVSAHSGARDVDKPNPWSNHKKWQGRVYSVRDGDKYPSIYAVCGWGQVDGLEGANCRHVHHPFWDGISKRSYTDEELEDIDPQPFTYQGKEYTHYQATQQQRKIERALRAVKRRMLGEKAAGLEDAYKASAVKYKRLNEEYDRFSAAAGLRPQRERANIPEFGAKEAREALKAASNQGT